MQFQFRMFNKYGFSVIRNSLKQTEKLEITTNVDKFLINKKNYNIIKQFNVYDNILTSKITDIHDVRFNKYIKTTTINEISKYMIGTNYEIDNVEIIFNNPFTVNNTFHSSNVDEDKITCIINLNDYRLSYNMHFYYNSITNNLNIKEFRKHTSENKINPLNGCININSNVNNNDEWLYFPTKIGDIIFINSKNEFKYNMNRGIAPLKYLHITLKPTLLIN